MVRGSETVVTFESDKKQVTAPGHVEFEVDAGMRGVNSSNSCYCSKRHKCSNKCSAYGTEGERCESKAVDCLPKAEEKTILSRLTIINYKNVQDANFELVLKRKNEDNTYEIIESVPIQTKKNTWHDEQEFIFDTIDPDSRYKISVNEENNSENIIITSVFKACSGFIAASSDSSSRLRNEANVMLPFSVFHS